MRIISGSWRSRKLRVPPGVRPTQDKQRETLFNILRPLGPDTSVLDLFAGTGSLGLEALSRGAAHATFVERSHQVAALLRKTLATLGGSGVVVRRDALAWLKMPPESIYDLVFVDPPFADARRRGWWPMLARLLRPHVSLGARVFLEGPERIDAPSGWTLLRSGRSGAAHWSLVSPAR